MVEKVRSLRDKSIPHSRMKSPRKVSSLRAGWSKVKSKAKSLRRVFSKKSNSWNVNSQSATIKDKNVTLLKVEKHRITDLGVTFTIDNDQASATFQNSEKLRDFQGEFVKKSSWKEHEHSSKPVSDDSQPIHFDNKAADVRNFVTSHNSERPAIKPPKTLKSELFSSPEIFERLDRRAVELARHRCNDLEKVAQRLSKHCENDLEKARVLFRWVVARDIIVRNARQLDWTVSTINDLESLQRQRELFHRLFQTLCNYAGLHCEIIRGYSKGAGYKPGMRITSRSFRNCWTAVAIDGTWRLVNCTWAARKFASAKPSSCDEFYFLTDPNDHIFQHYPDDPRWQLLEKPLPFPEFAQLPVVRSPFFNNSLRFTDCYSSRVISENGKAEIRLRVPENVKLSSTLRRAGQSPSLNPEAVVLLRMIGNEAIFTVVSCQPEKLYFSVYADGTKNGKCLENACSFMIKFRQFRSSTL